MVEEKRIGFFESVRVMIQNMLGSDENEVAFEDLKLEGFSEQDKKECLKAMKEVEKMAEDIGNSKKKEKKTTKISIEHSQPSERTRNKESKPKKVKEEYEIEDR